MYNLQIFNTISKDLEAINNANILNLGVFGSVYNSAHPNDIDVVILTKPENQANVVNLLRNLDLSLPIIKLDIDSYKRSQDSEHSHFGYHFIIASRKDFIKNLESINHIVYQKRLDVKD